MCVMPLFSWHYCTRLVVPRIGCLLSRLRFCFCFFWHACGFFFSFNFNLSRVVFSSPFLPSFLPTTTTSSNNNFLQQQLPFLLVTFFGRSNERTKEKKDERLNVRTSLLSSSKSWRVLCSALLCSALLYEHAGIAAAAAAATVRTLYMKLTLENKSGGWLSSRRSVSFVRHRLGKEGGRVSIFMVSIFDIYICC